LHTADLVIKKALNAATFNTTSVTNQLYHKMVGVLDTTLCDKLCQWFSPGTPVSSTNKTDRHDITEILLKVALNTTNQTLSQFDVWSIRHHGWERH